MLIALFISAPIFVSLIILIFYLINREVKKQNLNNELISAFIEKLCKTKVFNIEFQEEFKTIAHINQLFSQIFEIFYIETPPPMSHSLVQKAMKQKEKRRLISKAKGYTTLYYVWVCTKNKEIEDILMTATEDFGIINSIKDMIQLNQKE